jgi:hypothetical protein
MQGWRLNDISIGKNSPYVQSQLQTCTITILQHTWPTKKGNTVVLWFTPPVKSLVIMASVCLGMLKDNAVLWIKLQT